MWPVIFFIGLPIVLYKAIRDPVWAAMGGAYVYFAIPHIEFKVPALPYQAAFFGLAVLGSFRYYKLYNRWGRQEIDDTALKVATEAIELVRARLEDALVLAGLKEALPGEIRRAALEAAEGDALEKTERTAPAAIAISVRRAVQSALVAAADAGEQEVLKVVDVAGKGTKGNLRIALEERVPPKIDEALEATLKKTLLENVDGAVTAWEKDPRADGAKGPLGIPIPNGPLGGLGKNPGFWLHVVFIFLTWYGAENALRDPVVSEARVWVAVLLLIPLIAICFAVRNARHFQLFTLAWMFGTWHLAMNGITFWLQYGGRADSAGGQGGEANFLGAVIVAVAPIAFGMAINMPTFFWRVAGLGCAGCYALGVLASGSRAGLLAMIGSLGYWLMCTHRKLVAVGLACVAASGFLVVAPESFWEKMGTIMGEKDKNPWVQTAVEPSKGERLVLWTLAIEIWEKHPITGIGPLNYPIISAEETDFTDPYKGQRGLQAHSTWLQLLAEYGIIGGIVWAGSYLFALVCFRRARRRMTGYAGYEWFPALCLGFEAGAIASAIVLSFNSFQWYDYIYWHMIFGPLTYEIAKTTAERLDWMKPGEYEMARPPPRYGPPRAGGLDLGSIELVEHSPLSAGSRT